MRRRGSSPHYSRPRGRYGRLIPAAAILLPALVLAVLAGSRRPDGQGAEFQKMVGGLGLGPAVDRSWCAGEFDPRGAPRCSLRHEPVPCGFIFCPAHARVMDMGVTGVIVVPQR